MDYKNTLNLPQTGFAMKADLVTREPLRLAQWEKNQLYQKIQARRAGAEKFVLHDGPPFANGDVHIGTALNKILKDIIVKHQNLRGKNAPYVPGWDTHGLPIEYKVTQDMRKAGQTGAAPAAIRQACDAYARKYIDLQRAQFKRLGGLGDWENPYLTLNKEYEADELRLFADLVEKGFVYRGKKPVYWSIPARTALAEAEVEYHDHTSQSVYVKFPVLGQSQTFIVIWTTTPWTLPANLAVAYNSTLTYALVQAQGERYWVLSTLVSTVAEKCRWQDFQIERTAPGAELAALEYQHPFCQRTGKLLAGDNFVESSTGTGFVHIAPGHGLDDYNLGRQNGLPIYSPVNDDGALAWTDDLPIEQQMPKEMTGQSILEKHGKSDANVAVLHELRARHALLHEENYHHSYPYCWRSKTAIIFRAMDQWFIQIDKPMAGGGSFRQAAAQEIDRVRWVPEWAVNRIKSAVESRPDWCISRQRSWGVPIPAFYDASGVAVLDAQIVRNVAALVEKHGSNIWFEQSAAELWEQVKPAGFTGAAPSAKSNDTLDVWIDSGSSSRAVLMRRAELQHAGKAGAAAWQADVYLEGSDQHRGWFQSSLLLSLAANGAAPYQTVLTHGFMVDADREKISKSKQAGYEKPQTAEAYVAKYGADVVRLWVASQDYRNDIIVSDERINKVGETYRHLRNALRYQLSNLFDFDPARHTVADANLNSLDSWVLAQFARLEADVRDAYDRYEFHVVYQRISQFAAVELSAVYHDVVKDRLYTDAANSARRRSTQTALWRMARGLCAMLAPILSFTADEAWEFIPGNGAASVHLADWQPAPFSLAAPEDLAWKRLFEIREAVLPHLEKARQAKTIGKALEARVNLAGPAAALPGSDAELESLRELLNVSQLTAAANESRSLAVEIAPASGQKCERCWHWETDVGANPAHPTICIRCVTALQAIS
ncbi:MAG TPA: isoleucine--tRNA ligase [Verrucomicrobiae bacterium]|jgi:isoleucyl-tRNA synthetase|nr:isoleucine--tRNA ligase [Verrucomicrobiae bacterium]